ncbi:MAG: amidohydrolase family protein [Candidatus Scalinduaceae bacterium]
MLVLKAKYLLTDPYNIIENGAVLIDDGKITFAGCFKDVNKHDSNRIIDFANSAIVPGLINTHTHLELTNLHKCINYNGDFTDWIRQIVDAKKNWGVHDYKSSIHEGIKRSLESGTTTVADITRNGLAIDELKKSKIRKTLFYELIDFNPDSAERTIENFKEKLTYIKEDNLFTLGIFPHAPYTVSKELYKLCSLVSDELNINIATHISETNDEIEFLTRGTGRFMSLLRDYDMLNNWKYPGLRPINYLNDIGILENGCILIHCNYISEEEIDDIKTSHSSIVFCPRSHNYFCHENHPFCKFIENDINVALGTDSLASNDSLSILDEMRFLYENHKDIKPQDILYMGTIAGAIALGLKDKVGRLESGFDADITVLKLPEERAGNIYDRIFSQDSECIFTVVSGSVCYDNYTVNQE